MNLTSFAIENKVLTQFVVVLLVVGGVFSFQSLGRLEDPDFTVKTGVIVTQYPGASPREVELEVTDRIELALQEMPQLDKIYSISRAGLSIIQVDMGWQVFSMFTYSLTAHDSAPAASSVEMVLFENTRLS